MTEKYLITPKSSNRKTGPIMTVSSPRRTCPDACALKGSACYAEFHHTGRMWNGLDKTEPGDTFKHGTGNMLVHGLDALIDAVKRYARGALWRFNVFGDLPGDGDTIDWGVLVDIVIANAEAGARGFTYTHKPILEPLYTPRNADCPDFNDVICVREGSPHAARNLDLIETANARGFVINVSANNVEEADTYLDMGLPVAVVLPASTQGQKRAETPKGRDIIICPATYREDVTCASCGLCARLDRAGAIGFPAHGSGKGKI